MYVEATNLINLILQDEDNYKIRDPQLYKDFTVNCDREIQKLNTFIDVVNDNEQQIYIYGASTKGNCLLQYAKIDETKIKYAAERNLNKVGKMTSTGICIISEETMRENPPEYLLVLPWHFRDEIIEREDVYLENGGQLIFPFPNFEIYSKKEKVLVTGCDGMIAKYVLDEYKDKDKNKYNIYGFAHKNIKYSGNSNITKFYFDIKNAEQLELNLNIIKPDKIIHLSGVSSSIEAFKNPINTLELNGMTVAYICEIIHKNKWTTKLFNASSSEMFKGHTNYHIAEDSHNMYHSHPYSIAKIMGHSIVEFYRNTYNLPFSNGILFTVESKYKKGDFLLQKITQHAKKWKETGEIIKLGTLDSYRTILHGSDAASAIKVILKQNIGDNYVICGDKNTKIIDLVLKIYSLNGIDISRNINNTLYSNGKIVAIIENKNNIGIDNVPINITGKSSKLHSLGWYPNYSIDDIINELIS